MSVYIVHRQADFEDYEWRQPNALFTHRADWARYCTLCEWEAKRASASRGMGGTDPAADDDPAYD